MEGSLERHKFANLAANFSDRGLFEHGTSADCHRRSYRGRQTVLTALELPARSYRQVYATTWRFRGFLQFRGARPPKLSPDGRECARTVGQTFLLESQGQSRRTASTVPTHMSNTHEYRFPRAPINAPGTEQRPETCGW